MSTKKIMGIFIIQGACIGCVGTFLGLGCGVVLALLIEPFVSMIEQVFNLQFLQSDVYPLTYLPTQLQWNDILSVGSTALFLSFLATLYPAWRASKVSPAQALRYE